MFLKKSFQARTVLFGMVFPLLFFVVTLIRLLSAEQAPEQAA